MDPTDVRADFKDLSGSSFITSGYLVPGSVGTRLKGLFYTCVDDLRGLIIIRDGTVTGDIVFKMTVQGIGASDTGMFRIPGNGIRTKSGLFMIVTADGDTGGGCRSLTVLFG